MELIKPYLAAIIIILLSFNARAATVSVSPQSQAAIEGNNFTVSMVLEPEGSSVYGVQFGLMFNKTIVEALAVEKGTLLGSDGAVTIEGVKSIDNANGRLSYSISRSGTSTGINSSGIIASITFRGLSAGTTSISFADVKVSDPTPAEIPSSTQAGNVTVTAAATPTATATSMSTPTSTAIPGITQTSTPVSGTPPQQGSASQAASTLDRMELMYPNNTLVVLSSESSVSEGDEFIVSVHVKSTEPLYGAELKLVFDTYFLEGIKLEQGDFLSGSLVVNSLDNDRGELTYAETKVGNVAGVMAKGVLAKATFRAKKAGNTTIGLKDIKLVNENEAMVRDVLYEGMNLSISKGIARRAGMIGAYWALAAFVILVLTIKRRSR